MRKKNAIFSEVITSLGIEYLLQYWKNLFQHFSVCQCLWLQKLEAWLCLAMEILRTKFACDEFLSCCFIQGLMSQVATACYHHPPMILLQYSWNSLRGVFKESKRFSLRISIFKHLIKFFCEKSQLQLLLIIQGIEK